MKMVELFSGSKIMAETFRENGWDTLTIDIEEKFEPDICKDIFDVKPEDLGDNVDVIWASPPCQGFSVSSIPFHWTRINEISVPVSKTSGLGIAMLGKTLKLINKVKPEVWFIENPMSMTRKLWFMRNIKRHTITFCQYGENRMKPTDVWTNSEYWIPRKRCKNNDTCHEKTPRGSYKGTQGMRNAFVRGRLPKELCVEIEKVCRDSINNTHDGKVIDTSGISSLSSYYGD